MKARPSYLRTAAVLVALLCDVLIGVAQAPAADATRIDRLVALAKLWASVKYFHPWLAYRDNIDWDAAVIKAIPKVNAARDSAEYASAVESMLSELGDPVTRVLQPPKPAPATPPSSTEPQPAFKRNPDGVLIVSITRYTDLLDTRGALNKLEALKNELPQARAVVFDLRPAQPPSDGLQGAVSFAFKLSNLPGALTSVRLGMPSERRRVHFGYPPQTGATSGDYSEGFYLRGRQSVEPGPAGKSLPVVFLVGPGTDLPESALAFQAAGKGAIVSEGDFNEEGVVSTQTVDLPGGIHAQIRLGETSYEDGASGFAPNLAVPVSDVRGDQNPALLAAIGLAGQGTFPPPPRAKLASRSSAQLDNTYKEMTYPAAEYRVLAAFRIWAVIDYFFPYKEFIGEDWDAALRQFIPRMENAKDALDYSIAVAEMATHFHDSHGFISSPVYRERFESASAPIRVRQIEGLPVITGFTNAQAAKDAGFEIGDVILSVDGQDAGKKIEDRLKYLPHSTEQAGMFWATERSLIQGPKDSTAEYSIRDLHDKVRTVKVARKPEFARKTIGDRTGDVLRILPGNIGYADLDRLTGLQVDEMFEKFKDCPAIVFDDRGYPSGTAWQIAPRLTDKNEVVAALFKRTDPMSPDLPNGEISETHETATFLQRLPHTDKSRYHGKTVMLVDERTISQAEHTGLFFEAANGTKFIGSPTEGANGDVTTLSVPGGIYVSFSGEGVWHADGRQLQRLGLKPDVLITPTLAGIRAGKDEVLDRAIQYLQQGGN
jgi:C-terminal processing protease CtpA/Prc